MPKGFVNKTTILFTLSGAVALMISTHPTLGDYDLNKLKSKLPEDASTQSAVFWLNSY